MTDTFRAIQRRIVLRQHSHGWVGLCPFHNEKSPSFNVRPTHGTYHCFGCGEFGTLADLLIKLDDLS